MEAEPTQVHDDTATELPTQRVALVTGASAGIGRELAREFARHGHDVVLTARRRVELEQLAGELRRDYGVRVLCVDGDLGDSDFPTALHAQLAERGVQVEVLVNNAGFGLMGDFVGLDERRQLDMLQLNVVALTHLTRLFVPAMVQRGHGGVLNVASVAAFQPGPTMAVYHATKAFVVSFSRALREELRGSGVTVTVLCPGVTSTEFTSVAGVRESTLVRLTSADARGVARAGHRGLRRGRAVIVPGLLNRTVASSSRVLPQGLVTRLAARTLRSGRQH